MGGYRIVLADDHAMIRHGIRKILEDHPQFEVVGEAGDGLGLLEILKKKAPDLIILDISMPKLRGLEAISEARKICPAVKVIILTMHKSTEYVYHAVAAGADSYLLKEDTDRELLTAIEQVRKGSVYISSFLSSEFTADIIRTCRSSGKPPSESATTRERQVLKLVAEGKTSKEIADLLFISIRTVEHHRANFMKKLDLKTTADVIKYALEKGYIT
ncbi:MAG: response regulator transcription factor [Desulfobulbaceae bacterium]|nr:response regulator transcription factor [Desulfobulbaceae bacterium]